MHRSDSLVPFYGDGLDNFFAYFLELTADSGHVRRQVEWGAYNRLRERVHLVNKCTGVDVEHASWKKRGNAGGLSHG